jgi:dihydroneopterin aldolase
VSSTSRPTDLGGVSPRWDESATGQDLLRLEGMRFFGHHGCLADERSAGVHLDVDVEVRTDTREAARTDRVEDTIDYARLVEMCRRVVEDGSYHLVETVAERLAEGLLEEPKVASVRVRVAKRPPLAVAVDRFSVTVERRRG